MKTNTKCLIEKISLISIFSALIFVFTYFISIPFGGNIGYFNFSDGLIIFISIYFGPIVGIFSAIIGTSLSDIALGYLSASIFTLFAKGFESILAYFLFKTFFKLKNLKFLVLFLSIIPMILIYFLYYLILNNFDFSSSIILSLYDLLQGIIGVILSILLYSLFSKINVKNKIIY